MKKKIFICLMAASLLCGSISMPIRDIHKENTTASAAVYDTIPKGYTGIYTIDDLYAVRNNLSGKYILMNDIDMSETAPGGDWDNGNGWLPIDNFNGTFDGNGYAIKNMHIYGELDSDKSNIGLFGRCGDYSKILRLAIVNCNIDCKINNDTGTYVGAIAGEIGYETIDRCYTSGNIKVTTDKSNCYIGGICGGLKSFTNIVTNSFNTADIEINIVTNTNEDIENFYAGGLVGTGGRPNNIYNVGKITVNLKGEGEIYGGIGNLGGSLMNGTADSIGYYLKTLNDFDAYGGVNDSSAALTAGQMKSKSVFTGFDFDEVWTIDPNAEYPYPTLSEVPYVGTDSSVVEPIQTTIQTTKQTMTTTTITTTIQSATQPPASTGTKKGDMNGDGLVDAVDASVILAYYAYLSTGGTIDNIDEWMQNS